MTLTTTVAEGVLLFASGVSGVIVNTNNTHTHTEVDADYHSGGGRPAVCCRGEWCDC